MRQNIYYLVHSSNPNLTENEKWSIVDNVMERVQLYYVVEEEVEQYVKLNQQ